MMIKVGDKVKFLNDVGGGVITSFISNDMVNVENEDGFEIPYPIIQLLNVSAPELNKGFVKSEKATTKTKQSSETVFEATHGEIINGKNSADFYFCFVPTNAVNPAEGEMELHLVNDSNYTVMYHYSHFFNNRSKTIKYGNAQANSSILLESIAKNNLQELPEFGFQLLYFKDEENNWNEPVAKRFIVNPVKFYKESSFTKSNFFGRNAMELQITKNIFTAELDKLTEEDFKKVIREKEERKTETKAEAKKWKRTLDIVEIDLHINELIDSAKGLSNREILEIQKDKVESEMRIAIKESVKRVVFIHGVGQGILKQEVANLLKSKFKKYRFQDASFKEYGYGATLVILRR
jgi:hypothetical protein